MHPCGNAPVNPTCQTGSGSVPCMVRYICVDSTVPVGYDACAIEIACASVNSVGLDAPRQLSGRIPPTSTADISANGPLSTLPGAPPPLTAISPPGMGSLITG